jgi:hypothetical protein
MCSWKVKGFLVVYYESINHRYGSEKNPWTSGPVCIVWCIRERPEITKKEESTLLSDTGLVVELEHLKTKTRLIDNKFESVRGECETSIR